MYITYYVLLTDCLLCADWLSLIAPDEHMFGHSGYGRRTRTKAHGLAGLGPGGPTAPWGLVFGPGSISIVAEHICIKGNQQAFIQ